MTKPTRVPQVGSPDPERRNSPIVEETDEEFEFAGQELGESAVCYFNDVRYATGDFVCSGSELLRCARGGWVREGSCDPDNP